jgi:hypothetical protein
MFIIFFDIKGIVRKEFILTDQTINSANYCDVLRRLRENVRRLRTELWRQMNWPLHVDNTPPFFHHRICNQKQHDCRPALPFSVSTIGDKTEKPPF